MKIGTSTQCASLGMGNSCDSPSVALVLDECDKLFFWLKSIQYNEQEAKQHMYDILSATSLFQETLGSSLNCLASGLFYYDTIILCTRG